MHHVHQVVSKQCWNTCFHGLATQKIINFTFVGLIAFRIPNIGCLDQIDEKTCGMCFPLQCGFASKGTTER